MRNSFLVGVLSLSRHKRSICENTNPTQRAHYSRYTSRDKVRAETSVFNSSVNVFIPNMSPNLNGQRAVMHI